MENLPPEVCVCILMVLRILQKGKDRRMGLHIGWSFPEELLPVTKGLLAVDTGVFLVI